MLAAEVLFGAIRRATCPPGSESAHRVRWRRRADFGHGGFSGREPLWDAIPQRTPQLAAVVRLNGTDIRLPRDSPFSTMPAWIAPGYADLFQSDRRYYVGAHARDGTTEAFVYAPLDHQALASLTPGIVSVPAVLSSDAPTTVDFGSVRE